jgi:hypothetical protein
MVKPYPKVTSREEIFSISSNKKDLESYICKWHCRIMSHVDAGDPVYMIILTDGGFQEGAEEMILWTLPASWHKPSYDYTSKSSKHDSAQKARDARR